MSGTTFLQYATITLLCLICYAPAIPNSSFVFDDFVAIVRNEDVTNTERNILESISQIFQHDFWGYNIMDSSSHKSYRPLVTLTFHLEYRLIDGSNFGVPAAMKWNNLALHCLVSCLLFSVLKRMLHQIENRILFLGTLLFAVHPIHTEAVSGIVGRAELMCFLFYLGAIRVYLCSICKSKNDFGLPTIWRYAVFLTFTALAILCKEIGITVLPLCALYDLLINESIPLHKPQKYYKILSWELMIKLIVLVAATFGFTILRLYVGDFEQPKFKPMDNPVASADSLQTRVLSQNYLYVLNLWLLLCPNWLCFDWSFNSIRLVESLKDVRLTYILIFYFFSSLIIFKGKKTTQYLYLCLIVPFLPASGIIKLGFVIAERVLYIPSAGFCVLVSLGWDQLCHRYKNLKQVSSLILIFICVIFMLKTSHRSREWMNEGALFNSALGVCPNNAKVYYNIGRLASYQNDPDKALSYYQAAIRLYPDYDAALMNLGNLYRGRNNLDLAEKYIQQSIRITEEFPAAWMNLGIVKASKGLHNEAMNCYSKALKYRKRYANCYYNLGNLYLEMNDTRLAMQSWIQSLSISSKHSPSWVNILTMLDSQGKHLDVVALSTKALKILCNDPGIIFLRANAMGKLNRYEDAELLYKQAIALRPDHALYNVNLGVLYHRWNKKSLAVESYRKALAINPNLNNVRKYLTMLRGIRS